MDLMRGADARATTREAVASLVRPVAGPSRPPGPSLPSRALLALVRFYRRWLSPLKRTSTCRYLPTCSEYALQAISRHGAAKGTTLAAARILRCNPFFHAGIHQVPEAGRWVTCEHEGRH
jgi:putative membrane protein insertion efficiency factor